MSSINSISIEITENELKILYDFLDEVKNIEEFSLELINKYFDFNSISLDLKCWVLNNCSKTIYYHCDKVTFLLKQCFEADNIQNVNCKYCGNEISSHEHQFIYSFPSSLNFEIQNDINTYWQKKYLMIEYSDNISELKKGIQKIVPFIGAGLSVPLGLPDWKSLLKMQKFAMSIPDLRHRSNYEEFIEEGKLLEALDYLKERSISYNTDDQIKNVIVEKIAQSFNKDILEEKHNLYDVLSLDSNLYITTNYDLCLEEFIHDSKGYRSPLCLEDIDNIMKLMESESQILHLHGHIDRKKNMVVSKTDYTTLYEDDQLMFKLQSIISQRSLLYIGFSFSDLFFEDMYKRLNEIVKNNHYIILANPTHEIARQFNTNNIKVIGLNLGKTEQGSIDYANYVSALKVLINYLLE